MSNNQPEHQRQNKTELIDAKQQLQLLRELVESQNLIIDNLEKDLVEANQKLESKTEEFNGILMSGVSFEEAKAIANKLFKDEHISSNTLLAKLLSIIFNESVEATEIQGTVKFKLKTNQVITQSKKVQKKFKQLYDKYTELGRRFLTFTVNLNKIRDQLNTLTPPKKRLRCKGIS